MFRKNIPDTKMRNDAYWHPEMHYVNIYFCDKEIFAFSNGKMIANGESCGSF